MNGLAEVATLLQDMRPDMKRMADAVTTTHLRDVTRYIVSDELGCAVELEDAACVLADAIGGIEE